MKEMYNMFMKMEGEKQNEQEASRAETLLATDVPAENNKIEARIPIKLPEMPSPDKFKVHKAAVLKQIEDSFDQSGKNIEDVQLPDIPREGLGRSLQHQNNT